MIKNHVAILGNCKSDYFSLQIALGPTFLFVTDPKKTDGANGADSNAGAGTTGTDSGSSGSWLMAVPTPKKNWCHLTLRIEGLNIFCEQSLPITCRDAR